MSFELREHTADVAVAAEGTNLGETFAAVANGLTASMCEAMPNDGERFELVVVAENREALLYEYLADLIYQRDIRGVLPVDHRAGVECSDGEWRCAASARGVPLDSVDAREIKAVTYSEMTIEETMKGWRAYVVFDV